MKKALLLAAIAVVLVCCKPANSVVHVTDIKLNVSELSLATGDISLLTAEVLPSNASNKKIVWKSSDSKVAEVGTNGEVKAIAVGTATITVTSEDGNKTAECKVTVSGADTEVNGVKFEFVSIPAGSFKMGSPYEEPLRDDDENQHDITLSSFYMSKYEVTQAQWKAVMGADNNPSHFQGDNLPVEKVSYLDVLEFITKLNKMTQKEYRLPTEAEWEYACRAGTTTPFSMGEDITTDQANYNGNYAYKNKTGIYREKTTEVGTFAPNAWGLYDMHGNVWEWCSDWYDRSYYDISAEATDPKGPDDGTERVIRGGSWKTTPQLLRSANRSSDKPVRKDYDCGFRIVLPKK